MNLSFHQINLTPYSVIRLQRDALNSLEVHVTLFFNGAPQAHTSRGLTSQTLLHSQEVLQRAMGHSQRGSFLRLSVRFQSTHSVTQMTSSTLRDLQELFHEHRILLIHVFLIGYRLSEYYSRHHVGCYRSFTSLTQLF